jgi:hypothetical protein
VNDAQADTAAQREQALPRCPDELAERLQGVTTMAAGTFLMALLLSSRTCLAPVTLAARADEAGGPPPKFYEHSDNLGPHVGRSATAVRT